MKKRVLFSIYSISLILALIIFLIFQTTHSSEKTTYAESLTLNCSRSIAMSSNSQAVLLDGFISVKPYNKLSDITVTVTAKTSSDIGGLTYKENTITAIKQGSYTITFSVPASKTKKLTEKLMVEVNDDNSIVLNKNTLSMEEPTSIFEIVNINSSEDYAISVGENLEIENDTLIPLNVGEATLNLSTTKNFIMRKFSYTLQVLPSNRLVINITNVFKSKELYTIFYLVTNNEGIYVDQDLIVEIECSKAELIKNDAPSFIIKSSYSGKIKIKLICKNNPKFFANFEIEL